MKKITIILTIIFLFLLLFCNISLSHPHVFIEQRIQIVFDDHGLAGFNIHWTFDEMFTSMIKEDYDKNKNEILEKNEIALIKKEAFSYLENYNYFTFINIEEKTFDVKKVQDFSASLYNKKLSYNFFIPCTVSVTDNCQLVRIASYDPSYYSAVFFADNDPISFKNSELFNIETDIKEDKSISIYYGQIHPWAIFLELCKKQ